MTYANFYKLKNEKLYELKLNYLTSMILTIIMFIASVVLFVSAITTETYFLFVVFSVTIYYFVMELFKYNDNYKKYITNKMDVTNFYRKYYNEIYDEIYNDNPKEYLTEEERRNRARQRAYTSQSAHEKNRKKFQEEIQEEIWRKYQEAEEKRKRQHQERKEQYYREQTQNSWYNNNSYYEQKSTTNEKLSSDPVQNAYTLLNVNRNMQYDDIKIAYKKLAKKWHPNYFENDTKYNKGVATRNMQKLNKAHDLIKKDKGIK